MAREGPALARACDLLDQLAWGENRDSLDAAQLDEVAVARHDRLRLTCDGRGQDPVVVGSRLVSVARAGGSTHVA